MREAALEHVRVWERIVVTRPLVSRTAERFHRIHHWARGKQAFVQAFAVDHYTLNFDVMEENEI
ncbi:hypothetical protein AMTR_s00008p00209620 [Amborella trichopoda]|uniref:Uncharacterized protein n=1 Tax=Amborella trichopoda TaxID=13333 RepID=W1NIP6_AMBTC|nr:hypothetical protein AMTR_s00008p00209620 [Amborella trichopoda]